MDTPQQDKEQRQRLVGLARLGYSFQRIAQIESMDVIEVLAGIDLAQEEELNAAGELPTSDEDLFVFWDDMVDPPPHDRWLRLLLFVHRLGYSTTEIAKVMGIEQQGLKNYLSRAKREEELMRNLQRKQDEER